MGDLNRWSLSNNAPLFLCVSVISFALKDSQKPGWQKAGDGGFGDMREVDEGRSGRGSARQKRSPRGVQSNFTPPPRPPAVCCVCRALFRLCGLALGILPGDTSTTPPPITVFTFFFFLVSAVYQIRRHLPFIMCTLMDFKMTSAPEHLPPEYSVSTSLCLPVFGGRGGMHYARQEPS